MNSTADQSFTKLGTFTSYILIAMRCVNCAVNLATAVGGVYTAALKGGDALIANTQTYVGNDGAATSGSGMALNAKSLGVRTETPILSLTTPQGSAATADIYAFGIPLA